MTDHNTLEGAELDAAVALALGYEHLGAVGSIEPTTDGTPWCRSGCNNWWKKPSGHTERMDYICAGCYGFPDAYSSEWQHGGPIIERERICLDEEAGVWEAAMVHPARPDGVQVSRGIGSTPLVAAMRALVAAKSGGA